MLDILILSKNEGIFGTPQDKPLIINFLNQVSETNLHQKMLSNFSCIYCCIVVLINSSHLY